MRREKKLERSALQKMLPIPKSETLAFRNKDKIPNSSKSFISHYSANQNPVIIQWLCLFIICFCLFGVTQLFSPISRVYPNHENPKIVDFSEDFFPQSCLISSKIAVKSSSKQANLVKLSQKAFNWRKGFFLLQFKYKGERRFVGLVCRAFNASDCVLGLRDLLNWRGVLFCGVLRSFCRSLEEFNGLLAHSTLRSRSNHFSIALIVMEQVSIEVSPFRPGISLFCYKREIQVNHWHPFSILPSFFSQSVYSNIPALNLVVVQMASLPIFMEALIANPHPSSGDGASSSSTSVIPNVPVHSECPPPFCYKRSFY